MPIINSILDSDLYKFTMQKAVLAYKQDVPVEYNFINRRPEGKFTPQFLAAFQEELHNMSKLALSKDEASWLENSISFLGHNYIEYLRNYRYDPSEIDVKLINGDLKLKINGTWERTILWEVPLMAVISELYFFYCDTNWSFNLDQQEKQLKEKCQILQDCSVVDFGTRRRRNYKTQDLVVNYMRFGCNKFVGTSNVHLAHKYNIKPIGTMAHEWMMGISALEGLRHANRYALNIWSKIFDGRLGIALPDTFGTDAFFEDFDNYLTRLYDGVRHDSDDPIIFAEKSIAHYKKLHVDPLTKTIVFSDNLNASKVAFIKQKFEGKIRTSFGVGTHLTNDFPNSPALNMVIKLSKCNGIPVVKISDSPTKAIGDKDALRVANWTFFGKPLDQE